MSAIVDKANNAAPLTHEEGTSIITKWLNQRLRITITDTRIFEGWFKCVDRDCNIVLAGTQEFHDGPPPPHSLLPGNQQVDQERFIGLIVIPGKHVKNIELIHPAR